MKKILSLFLLLIIAAISPLHAQWDGTSEPWTQGSGTAADPYLIQSPGQLAFLADMVSGGINTYSGVYFLQTNDINLNNQSWIPIGNADHPFQGNYDGGGHRIDSLLVNNDSYTHKGLFGYASDGSIRNVNCDGVITSNNTYQAIIVAEANNMIIENILSFGSVTSLFYYGDFPSYSYYHSSFNSYCAGIVGFASGTTLIDQCFNYANIDSRNNCTGGIVGRTIAEIEIKNCGNNGNINVIGNCNNDNNKNEEVFVGGIIGFGTSNSIIFRCYNRGTITVTGAFWYRTQISSGDRGYCGGISGKDGNVSYCYNTGNMSITSSSSSPYRIVYLGGIGFFSTVSNSYYTGTLSNLYTYVSHFGISETATNSYYREGCGATSGGTSRTEASMKSVSFPIILNTDSVVFAMDSMGENGGYPVFKYNGPAIHTVTATSHNMAYGTVSGSGEYAHGSQAWLTATPNEYYQFVVWNDGNTDNPRGVTVTSDTTLIAYFAGTATGGGETVIVHDTTRIHDTTIVNTVQYDTTIINTVQYDTTIVNHYAFDTNIYNHFRYDTTMTFDTVIVNVYTYDTSVYNNYRYDTVILNHYEYDTTIVNIFQYDTTLVNVSVFDTTINNVYRYDTTIVNVLQYDTTLMNIFDTTLVNYYQYDTTIINHYTYDSPVYNSFSYDTTLVFDTLIVNIYNYDTSIYNNYRYDTVIINYYQYDTMLVNVSVFDTTINNIYRYDTTIINVLQYDTSLVNIFDTTLVNYYQYDTTVVNHYTYESPVYNSFTYDTTWVFDTMIVNIYTYDTSIYNNYQFDTVILNQYQYDTTLVYVFDTVINNVYQYDTTIVFDTTIVNVYDTNIYNHYEYDTVIVNNYYYDTVYVNSYTHDTVNNYFHDTINNYYYDTVVITHTYHDTVFVTNYVFDTIYLNRYIFDTVYIHDTIVVGVDEVEAINAKIYTSQGHIVVDGAEGNTVWLYDVNGRVLATKQDEYMPLRFDVPASGTYLVKVGNHPARKVVVIR